MKSRKIWFVEVSLHHLDQPMDLEIWEVMLFVKDVEIKKSIEIEIDRRPPHPSPLNPIQFLPFSYSFCGSASYIISNDRFFVCPIIYTDIFFTIMFYL